MGSFDLKITALQNGAPAQENENTVAPKVAPPTQVAAANQIPTVSSPIAQQDTVSLSGMPLPQQLQQKSPAQGTAQPATFALLANTTTFPPSQDSTVAFTKEAFPPGVPAAAQNQARTVIAASAPNPSGAKVIATSNARAIKTTQTPFGAAVASTAASASPNGAANSGPTPQTLEQLDRGLQQLGINPQSLSLISREGMLNWVNDPAALRQIVQNVQSAANSAQQNTPAGAANPEQTTEQTAVAGLNQNQLQPSSQVRAQAAAPQPNPVSANSQLAASANTDALGQTAAAAQQNATAVQQFQQLQNSLTSNGPQEPQPASNPGSTNPPQGQLLNVSA